MDSCRLMAAVLLLLVAPVTATERPNILWLSCEDISPHLGCYGDPHAITPHLDNLAEEGVRFTHAYTTAGVCAPCRSAVITGMYQTTLGTHHMRCTARLPEHVRPFPAWLREAGYYCSNNSKQDYQFRTPKGVWHESSRKAHWRRRPDAQQPFFSVFNFTGCHESGIANEEKYRSVTQRLTPAQRQDPGKLQLPPYYPDTPVVREDWKRNYELITAMDAWAGDLLQQLDDDGLRENTIVMFWSDHGVGLPRAKRWLYESGTHIPLIVRIPQRWRRGGQGRPGSVDDQLVSGLDFAPTVLHLAGLPIPDHFQGRAFLGPDLSPPRSYVFGARDRMDERYDIIRMVRDKQYRYIRNYEPFKPWYQYMNTPEQGATMRELRRLHALGQLPPAAEQFMAARKPVEELYDVDADPHEIHNIAADPRYADKLQELRQEHLRWVTRTSDIGLMPESEIELREQAAGSRMGILQQAAPGLMDDLRATAGFAIDATQHEEQLNAAARHADAAVRYWALVGLGNLPHSAERETAVAARLDDSAPCVRIAAAQALLRYERPARALPVLQAELRGPHQWARLRAAIVLDEADDLARPAIDDLRACLSGQPNKYITRVANRALNELLGTSAAVP